MANYDPVIEAFTEGDCWHLAMHMSKISGWRIAFVGEHGVICGCLNCDGNDIPMWTHAFVVNEDGTRWADVTGEHDISTVPILQYGGDCWDYIDRPAHLFFADQERYYEDTHVAEGVAYAVDAGWTGAPSHAMVA